MSASGRLHVVAGILTDDRGRVLLARRLAHAHQGGKWEFPGGKVEPGEAPEAALIRELREELDVRVERAQPFLRVPHDYGDRNILLDVWRVTRYTGEPRAVEGQGLSWFELDDISALAMPAANRPIARALILPPHYLITPHAHDYDDQAFLSHTEAALTAHDVRLMRLRSPGLESQRYLRLAAGLVDVCRRRRAQLMLDAGFHLPGCGQHLNSQQLMSCERRPLPESGWLAASCHNAAELEHARVLGCDFVVLSPVQPTPGHADARLLGWDGFRGLALSAGVPVYALGGIGPSDLDQAIGSGAIGVAGIRALWARAAD